ncbi:MAG: hypothetical protein R6U89_05590 [Dehalococcoidia bacterium]
MPNISKQEFLAKLKRTYGVIRKIGSSQSLYEIGNGAGRIYIRYSKLHSRGQAFYGLRKTDLQILEGHRSVICFLWENQAEPLFIPYIDFEEVFHTISPASDGQYKAHIFLQDPGCDLYIAKAGRFNVEAFFGWDKLDSIITKRQLTENLNLSHTQVQTLLGSIGAIKGYGIWIPRNDRSKLDWELVKEFECNDKLPHSYNMIEHILSEIDVIWFERGANKIRALFEVEHSTPIYSGLLRFNDVHLMTNNLDSTYTIVSNDDRRALFVRQLRRPTFTFSKLGDNCTFLEYPNVYSWHKRLSLR